MKSSVIKPTFALKRAKLVALDVFGLLRPDCEKLEIAGSIRRGKDPVHDVDLVAWAHYHDIMTPTLFGELGAILNPPSDLLKAIKIIDPAFVDPPAVDPKILHFTYERIPVELYLTERDGSNWGALLQMRTGSAEYNEFLACSARHKRMYYRAGYGIYEHDDSRTRGDFGARLDDGTEEGIFATLGLQYQRPAERIR